MGPLGAKVSKLESLKSPVTTKVERGLIRISSFSWLSRSAISAGISSLAFYINKKGNRTHPTPLSAPSNNALLVTQNISCTFYFVKCLVVFNK